MLLVWGNNQGIKKKTGVMVYHEQPEPNPIIKIMVSVKTWKCTPANASSSFRFVVNNNLTNYSSVLRFENSLSQPIAMGNTSSTNWHNSPKPSMSI
jgi:hypothetical protein